MVLSIAPLEMKFDFTELGYGISAASIIMMLDITPVIASASIHISEGLVGIVSAISHWSVGNVEKSLFLRLFIPGVAGAVVGASFLLSIPASISKLYVSLILFGMGIIIFSRFLRRKIIVKKKLPMQFIPFLGFVAAYLDVSGCGGWGPLCTPTFILGGAEPRKAVGTVEATEPIISITAIIFFAFSIGLKSFLWRIIIPITLGGILLTPIAAWLTKQVPKKILGIFIGLWLIILNGRLLITFF